MGLSGTNRGVLLYDLERNEELKKYLKEIVPEEFEQEVHTQIQENGEAIEEKVDENCLV